MDDSKKIFPGNFENGTAILPPRITSSRSRGYVAPSRRKPTTGDGEEEERITNQKKSRYWNSYEEMHIVELWRRYKDEVTEFTKPLPVHRKIMVAMRSKDMMVTGQDCRRKINTLNNRYKTELQRMNLNGVKPDWRLFPLIHCIMEPKKKTYDAWHETMVVKKLLEKIPKPPPEFKCPPPTTMAEPTAPTTSPAAATPIRQPVQQHRLSQSNGITKGSLIASIPLQSIQTNTKIPIFSSDNANHSPLPPLKQPSFASSSTQVSAKSNLPYRDITLKKYEQMKLTNEILTQQRDATLKRLRLEEESLKAFETLLCDWNEQTREILKRIERLSRSSSSSVNQSSGEGNNGHVEQTLSVN